MVKSSVQLALVDLLAYLLIGGLTVFAILVLAGYSPVETLSLTNSLAISSGTILVGACYLIGYLIHAIRDWLGLPFCTDEGLYWPIIDKLQELIGFQFCKYCKERKILYEDLSTTYRELMSEHYPKVANLKDGVRDQVENDFSARHQTDENYMSRMGAFETFVASLTMVFIFFGIGSIIRAVACDESIMFAIGAASLFLGVLCWGEEERINEYVRLQALTQAIAWLLFEKTA